MSEAGESIELKVGPFEESATSELRTLSDLPGPKGMLFFGNTFQVTPETGVEVSEGWAREDHPFCVARFPGAQILFVNDAGLTEKMLRSRPEAFRRWSKIESVFEEVGAKGLFSVDGETWRVQRKLVMHALSQRHLRGFFPTLQRVNERLLGLWQRAADEERPVLTNDDLMRFTTDVTVSLAFSTDMNSLENVDDTLNQHLALIFPAVGRRLDAIIPYWRYLRFPKDHKLDRALKEIRKLQRELLLAARQRIEDRHSANSEEVGSGSDDDESPLEAQDMLEAMLLARDEEGAPFSDEALYGNMLTMLLAGEDTTAFALSWALHFLCDHPEVVERMRQELFTVVGDAPVTEAVELTSKLPFIDAVAQETLRLKSPAPAIHLEALEDVILGDVFVPKATVVLAMTRLPANQEEHFSDPEAFRPERWLNEVPGDGNHQPRTSIPFGSGPRICPGRALALLEMRLVLSMLVQNFDIARVGAAEDVIERTLFVARPVGVQVKLRRRNRAAA